MNDEYSYFRMYSIKNPECGVQAESNYSEDFGDFLKRLTEFYQYSFFVTQNNIIVAIYYPKTKKLIVNFG